MVWPVGSDAWRPLVYDDDGRQIELPTARASLLCQPATKPRSASAGTPAHCSSQLRADAPEFMPTASGQNLVGSDTEVDILDPHFTPVPAYPFPDASSLPIPCIAGCGYQPEMYMAAMVGVTNIGQSGNFHETSDPNTDCMPFTALDETGPISENEVKGREQCTTGATHTANTQQTASSNAATTGTAGFSHKSLVDLAAAAALAFVAGVFVASFSQKAVAMEL